MKIRGKTLGKRLLSVLLMLAMLLGIAPGMTRQAYAANEPAAAADTYEVDGVKYYNIHSTSKGKQDIYMDMIKSPMPYTKGVNVRLWEAWLALAVQLSYAQFDDIFFYDARARLFNPNTSGENVYEYQQDPYYLKYDINNPWANNNRRADRWNFDEDNAKKIYDGNLAYRTSVEWVNDQEYKDGGYVKATYTIQNKNTENILAVYEVDFYDFEATALLPPDQGNNYVTTTVQDSTTSNSTLSTTVKNNTANAQSASVTTSTSLSSTASHTREGGTDLTFTESLNVSLENELSVGVASVSETTKVGVNVGFEATQLVKRSFSDTTGETKTDEKTITETITLPAHTQALMTTENSKSTITTKYNGPFAMDYTAKVTIKYNTQGPTKKYSYYSYTSNGKTATYTFDATARSDLYQRALVDGGTNYDREGINWVKARKNGPMKWESASNADDRIDIDPLELCATCLPMMDTPAQFTQKVEGASISYSLWPILPLNSIKVSPPEYITFISTGESVLGNYNYQTANMKIGDSFRTSQLNLTGLDTDNVEFYNFSKNNGHWVIADANGNEQEGDNLPVKLVDEYGIVVKAVRPGTCYLKYVIDENCYAVANNPTSFIKNSDLTGGTAGIKINVAAAPVTITVENNYTNGTVSADPDYLDSDDKADTTRFYVTCVDNNDNGKNLEYIWDAQETTRQGIKITTDEDGYSLVQFNKPGTYHVRVKTTAGDYCSDWYEIEATGSAANVQGFEDPVIDAAEDTEFVIVGDYEGTSGARPDPMETVSCLNVYAFDPTGKMLPVRYVWKAQETEGIEVTEDGFVTFSEPGTYHVRVESPDNPDYHSDWKEITAKQGSQSTAKTYTVTFLQGDGTDTVYMTANVEENTAVNAPETPVREGYTFGGWYRDETLTNEYDFTALVTENLTLYPKWTKSGEEEPEVGDFEAWFAGLSAKDAYDGLYYNSEKDRYETVYTGFPIKPAVLARGAGELLTEGVDYSVSYSNNRDFNEGKPAKVTITGKSKNFTGKKILEFYILQADLAVLADRGMLNVPNPVTVVKGQKANPVLTYGEYTLNSGDRTIDNTKKLETDTDITITGKKNFTGTLKDVHVSVMSKADTKAKTIKATVRAKPHVYNGAAQTLGADELIVTDGTGKVLKENEGYTTVYINNINAGTAKVNVRAAGEYLGTVSKTFKITPDKTSEIKAALAYPDQKITYSLNGAKPAISVSLTRNGDVISLTQGVDYKVSYSKNTKVGTGYYSVSFLGNYKGHAALKNHPFTIEKASLKEANAAAADMIYKKPGKYFSAPYVSLGNVLLKNTDYTVRYFDEAGKEISSKTKLTLEDGVLEKKITIKITGRGNYAENDDEAITTTYQIKRFAASSVDLSKGKIVAKEKNANGKDVAVGKQEYNGKALTPAIRVLIKDGNVWKELPEEAYEVTYINNVNKGNAVILVNGKGAGYVGSKAAKFTITSMRIG